MSLWAIRSIFSLLRHPTRAYWRRYFAFGYRKQWDDYKETGWREMPDSVEISYQCVGVTGEGEIFYANAAATELQVATVRSDEEWRTYLNQKIQNARDFLNSFLDPRCGCKIGWHWKCRFHRTWQG